MTVTSRPEPVGTAVPAHVGIIMDGNGRWAARRHLPRLFGHREGVNAVRRAVRAASELGVKYLTLYSFSSENWSRPRDEVEGLLGLLRLYIRTELDALVEQGVRVRIIGSRAGLPDDILSLIAFAESRTRACRNLTLVIAFNYGGRDEIAEAARRIAADAAAGRIDPASITRDVFAGYLSTDGIPDPDLIIRTSGEQRVSNFLIWQSAYAEFVWLETLWPDFDKDALVAAIAEFGRRDRRFGGLAGRAAL